MTGDDPLLVTARLDPGSQARLDALRRRHFPADRLVVGAHLMLVHRVDDGPEVLEAVREVCARTPFAVDIGAPRSLGRGVAYPVGSAELQQVRAALVAGWDLSPQDRQPFRPHVTVQNKVDGATARATLEALTAGYEPWSATVLGLEVWAYRGGPWEARRFEAFRG